MKYFLIKWFLIIATFGLIAYFFTGWVIFFAVLWFLSLFSGGSGSRTSSTSGLSEDELDGERDPAWNGRDMNEIYDNDGLGDWDLDGKREEKF
mgnify:CR=1 FL=1